MTNILKILCTCSLAYGMQLGVDWLLPADMSRLWVITWAGVGAIVWSKVDDVIWGRSYGR